MFLLGMCYSYTKRVLLHNVISNYNLSAHRTFTNDKVSPLIESFTTCHDLNLALFLKLLFQRMLPRDASHLACESSPPECWYLSIKRE